MKEQGICLSLLQMRSIEEFIMTIFKTNLLQLMAN